MMDPDSAAALSQRRLFEAALRKARPRPLVVSRLRTSGDSSGYSSCLCGDAALLSAFCIQVGKTTSDGDRSPGQPLYWARALTVAGRW
jgi:hypothetical protein